MKIILHVTVEQWRLDIINTMHTKNNKQPEHKELLDMLYITMLTAIYDCINLSYIFPDY